MSFNLLLPPFSSLASPPPPPPPLHALTSLPTRGCHFMADLLGRVHELAKTMLTFQLSMVLGASFYCCFH